MIADAKETLKAEDEDRGFRREREKSHERDREALLAKIKQSRKNSQDLGIKDHSGIDVESDVTTRSKSEQLGRKLEALFESSIRELDAYDWFVEQQISAAKEEARQNEMNKAREEAARSAFAGRGFSKEVLSPGGISPATADPYMSGQRRSMSGNYPSTPVSTGDYQRHLPDQTYTSRFPATDPSINPARQAWIQGGGDHDSSHKSPPKAPAWGVPRVYKKHPRTHVYTCRFWMAGHCLVGDACTYRHDHLGLPPPPK